VRQLVLGKLYRYAEHLLPEMAAAVICRARKRPGRSSFETSTSRACGSCPMTRSATDSSRSASGSGRTPTLTRTTDGGCCARWRAGLGLTGPTVSGTWCGSAFCDVVPAPRRACAPIGYSFTAPPAASWARPGPGVLVKPPGPQGEGERSRDIARPRHILQAAWLRARRGRDIVGDAGGLTMLQFTRRCWWWRPSGSAARGSRRRDRRPGGPVAIETNVHLLSDHVTAARAAGLTLRDLRERVIDDRWIDLRPQCDRTGATR
jgi:hypothetical protein